ncbi:hypothetical protein ANN_02377 [Periplaneta americana]|uniref:RNase H type-1 domain-containing protein n=1 Tax=Periplaneta americana TaxID=6978 RepID=A0ABQ8TW34_PERAM|nr:hypothetical protein ANN_02377 [Periplaneta americana]
MSPGSSTESYPAFAHIGLRENPGRKPQQGIFRSCSFFMAANVRKGVAEGRSDCVPIFLSEIPLLFHRKIVKPDVAFVQVSPPDQHGYCSLGTSVDCVRAALMYSKTIVGMYAVTTKELRSLYSSESTNAQNVWGWNHPSVSLDYAVNIDTPLPEHGGRPPTDVETKIGQQIAGNLVDNGATLQMGIGNIPDAVLAELTNHKDLGIHSEMFAGGIVDLVNKGCITNNKKTINRGKIIGSFLIGTRALYDFVDNNPYVEMRDVSYVNNTGVIAQNPKMTAINSCIEIDLTGQVVSDSIGTRMYSDLLGMEQQVLMVKFAISESLRNLIDINKFKNAVILSDSKAAILSIVSKHTPSSQTAEITKMLSQLLSLNKRIVFQWIPSHCGILGNENVDALAKKGNTATYRPVTKSTYYSVKRFIKSTYLDFNKQNLITQSQGKKWNSLHQNPQLIPDLPRKLSVAAFRLATGHDCLAKHLHRIGIYQSPNCPLCNSNQEMDSEHLKICASVAGHDNIFEKYWNTRGFGGQVDFIRGAAEALDGEGKPIIALPSVTNKGESKISPVIKSGAGVVTTRAHVHYVVTEHGVAYLFGKSLRQRAHALINIAHPNHRESLEKAAFERLKCMPSP